jgi:membrane-associated protein
MLNTALPFLHQFSYLGIFLLLAGGAIVLPIPEEITLLTAGYLVAMGVISPYLGIPIAVLGLLSGDALLFGFARVGSNYAHKLRTRIHKIGLEKTWIFSPKQPLRAVFILRFLTGLRFIAPVYAGFEEASWKGFLLVDTAAIVIFTTIMFALGFAFNASIIAFIAGFEIVRHSVFIAVLAFAGAGMLPTLYRLIHRHVRKRSVRK